MVPANFVWCASAITNMNTTTPSERTHINTTQHPFPARFGIYRGPSLSLHTDIVDTPSRAENGGGVAEGERLRSIEGQSSVDE